MSKLTLHSVQSIDDLAFPEKPVCISMNSPAKTVFTDFIDHEPMVVDASMTALEARNMMIKTHVRLKLVVDEHNQFLGVIGAEHLSDQYVLLQAANTGLRSLKEVLVAELMVRKKDLVALDYAELDKSTIGNVVNFLQDNHQQHCLVIDQDNHTIRGLFSASDISRKLRLPIDIHEQSSFARVFSAVS
ncbi:MULTISPECIES: CBS domain-containing protein [unclassified Oceanobacter]|jgi:CBS domain containing-hemolysin-like protein|uniref:CBS domain-containing protein n=2 Tax=Gammaproteobacteria TaxID=1236 RepID=UPI0027356EE9|nr:MULTISPECIES: CBS domain-containing protein [unclassified Oceanobacter]MDP2505836.1 CBS domain-containing protein [Oceanobacter sp. 3_MG-2023]MDP2548423.1 CBS domain-containing protein [Oceanobacter sp. 4_MG-2023]MDP2609130.1 CBS domain-containing protein [Oceanobacter sp. 1_MG-2023]MDP2612452.1 CBS domain-containing protein [Oceanobacter sp. 2_MG-2023]